MTTADAKLELVAKLAEIIHDAMVYAATECRGAPQPWQNGNSTAESYARREARDFLTALEASPVTTTEAITRAMIEAGCAALAENLQTTSDVDAKIVREILEAGLAHLPRNFGAPEMMRDNSQLLRAVYRTALTLCNNATDECRDDEQVLVPGDDLKALNDALDAVEEAEDDQ